ncbi:hypothetical protein EB796_020209 [Bugula neritina]|uniref:Uncharacterized protein n=1 Tax=Bugula neritina TaxID=10212 RepID=A0A7J7J5P1_BUGNE|nr:hypothetical protein EB796_020209 [Bugula neritina]
MVLIVMIGYLYILSKSNDGVIERYFMNNLVFYYAAKSVTITWTINWDSSITLSTTIPITTLSETSPCAGINRAALGGGLAGGCLLLIITAGVAFHLGKLKGIRSQAHTGTDNSPYTELSVTRINNSPYAELSVTRTDNSPYIDMSAARTDNSTYTDMSVTRMDDHNYDSLNISQKQTANTDNDEAPSGQTYVNIRS